ncbi:MAG: hypothetical protein R3C14_54780 [Caldilineaceae bacterium]
MNVQLRLTIDQISTAILLLSKDEKRILQERMPILLQPEAYEDAVERLGWLQAAESAFDFWHDPAEDIYDDLIPTFVQEGQ